jgi:hypothetical protein
MTVPVVKEVEAQWVLGTDKKGSFSIVIKDDSALKAIEECRVLLNDTITKAIELIPSNDLKRAAEPVEEQSKVSSEEEEDSQ